MNLNLLIFILFSVSLSALAQLFLKIGATRATLPELSPSIYSMMLSPFVWIGLGLYGLGTIIWLFVLAKAPLSFAYPFVGLGFIFTAVLGYFVLNEQFGLVRIVGIMLIAVGCVLVARSA